MPKPVKTIKTLADLTPDSMNPNKGTERGRQLVDQSLTAYGFGRSILVDRSANVIAGNKTLEAALNHDLPVRVIQTDGSEVIAVQRTDIDLFSTDDHERQTARGLSIVDNEATLQGYERDAEMLLTHEASGVNLAEIIPQAEIEHLKAVVMAQSAGGREVGIKDGKPDFGELWQGMPEFDQPGEKALQTIIVRFDTREDVDEFARRVEQSITPKTKSIWFPYKAPLDGQNYIVESES